MKWKPVAVVCAFVLASIGAVGMVSSLSGPAESPTAAPPAASRLDTVLQRGEIRVCSTGDYRPFTYRDANGEWTGIDIDMARDLAARLGVEATIVPTTWETLMADFKARCDIAVGGVSITLDRATEAFFSNAYIQDGKTPITRCENVDRFGTLEQIDRPGVRAIVNPGGTNEQFARDNLAQATIVEHPDNNTIFGEIIAGRADLMMTDAAETKWQAKRHPELCAAHPDDPFSFSEKAYLLPRGDVVFQQALNQWLDLAMNDGTYARLAAPWIG